MQRRVIVGEGKVEGGRCCYSVRGKKGKERVHVLAGVNKTWKEETEECEKKMEGEQHGGDGGR